MIPKPPKFADIRQYLDANGIPHEKLLKALRRYLAESENQVGHGWDGWEYQHQEMRFRQVVKDFSETLKEDEDDE